jgi:hypothetical protein
MWAALAEWNWQTIRLAIVLFILAPIMLLVTAFIEVGQAIDLFVQGWLAGPHQDHPELDFLLGSGFGACLTIYVVEVALVTAFFALWRRRSTDYIMTSGDIKVGTWGLLIDDEARKYDGGQ